MKTTVKLIALVSLPLILAFTTLKTRAKLSNIPNLQPKPVNLLVELPEFEPIEIITKTQNDFLDALGHRESGNRYDVINKFGYLGKYQFGKATLKGLGYNISPEEFINNPSLQEEAMIKLLQHNKKKLNKLITKYDGKTVHGVLVTESGILAAAHLAGQGNVKKFLRRGKDFQDGFGTKMTSYILQFNNYSLNL